MAGETYTRSRREIVWLATLHHMGPTLLCAKMKLPRLPPMVPCKRLDLIGLDSPHISGRIPRAAHMGTGSASRTYWQQQELNTHVKLRTEKESNYLLTATQDGPWANGEIVWQKCAIGVATHIKQSPIPRPTITTLNWNWYWYKSN
jgi:hypothetical protein